MRVKLKAAPVLAVLAAVLLAVGGNARSAPTAAQVRDDDSLKAFVEGVKADIEAITDPNRVAGLTSKLRTEGDWRSMQASGPMKGQLSG